ncbi:propanediol utilization protein [bacterium (Candidatus Torokbacteria) CG09_land_8_20_14_0_10_42_11]|nr:MAG: propanediol utilization protein [bacterium (Candidatus Torokbacteria) CG09_land_8_20_14_0_10_42_11]
MSPKILVEISGRHVHLSEKDKTELFGADYVLTKLKDLSQPGLFACQETVEIQVGEKKLKKVRIIGPPRAQTQIEISQTDGYFLKIEAPLRLSGDLADSPECKIIGPKGEVNLKEGLIIAKRHLHLSPEEARGFNLKNNQEISLKIDGERGLTFHKIIARVSPDYKAAVHLDTDEGNAAGIVNKTYGEISFGYKKLKMKSEK